MERAADRSKAADDAEQDSGKTNWSRRGRKKGSGSYDKLDAPLLDEMHELIKNGDAVSINDAAGQVASKAKGSSTESKITRLSKKYAKQFGSN